MDVERKTTITAGMNAEPMKQALRDIGDEAAKTATRIAQSTEQMSRAMQSVPRSFDAMQKKFVDGYSDALKYADAWKVVQNTLAKGGDALNNAQTILTGLSKQFGLTAQEAEAAAKRMHDAGISNEERLKAQKALMEQVIAGRKRLAEEAAFQAQDPAQLDALRAKYDPLFAAQQKYAKQVAEITQLQQQQMLGDREAAAALEKVTVAYQSATAALDANNAASLRAAELQAGGTRASFVAHMERASPEAAERAAQYQAAINAQLGVRTPDTAGRAADIAAYGEALDALRAKLVPLFAAQQQYKRLLEEIAHAEQTGAIAAGEASNVRRDAAMAIQRQEQALRDAHEAANREALGIRDPAASKSAEASAAVFSAAFDAEAKRLDYLIGKYNPLLAAQEQHKTNLAEINEAAQKGALIGAQIADAQQRETERYQAQVAAINGQKAGYDQLRASVDSVFAVSQKYAAELERIDQLQAMGMAGPQADKLRQDAQQRFQAATQPQIDTQDKLRRQYDPLYAASKKYADGIDDITKRSAALNLTSAQTAVLLENHRKQYEASVAPMGRNTAATNQYVGANGQLQFAMRQLGVQATQTFSGLATGQPIMMTLVQQGHQVIDIMLATGISFSVMAAQFRAMALSLLTNPFVLIAAAIGSVVVALGLMTVEAEKTNRALKNLENQARGVRVDFGPMAKQAEMAASHLAQTTALSFAEAFAATSVLAKTPNFVGTQTQMENLVKTAQAMRDTFGGDLASNMDTLVKGMTKAGDVAKDLLAKGIDGVKIEWVQMIQTLESKDPSKAFDLLVAKINSVAQAGEKNATALEKEWERFLELVTGSKEGSWRTIGESIADGLITPTLRELNDLIELWQKFVASVSRFRGSFNALGSIPIIGAEGVQPTVETAPGVGAGAPYSAVRGNNLFGLRPQGKSTGFQTFGTPEESVVAAIQQIQIDQERHRQMTLRDLIAGAVNPKTGQREHGWAPASENDVNSYLANLKALTGLDVDKTFDARDRETITKIVRAIARIETGKQIPQDIIDRGVEQSFSGAKTGAGVTQGGGSGGGEQGVRNLPNPAIQTAVDAASGTIAARGRALQDEMNRQVAGLKAAQEALAKAAPGTEEYKQAATNVTAISQRIQQLTSEIYKNVDANTQQARSLESANEALKAQTGAAREYAEVEEQLRQQALANTGGMVNQEARTRALAAVTEKLSLEQREAIRIINQQADTELATVEAHEKGGVALEHALNIQRAMTEADKFAVPNTEAHKAVVLALAAAYDHVSASKREVAAADFKHQLDEENESLALQEKLLGASTAEVNRQTAALRARRSQGLAAGDQPTASQQRNIEEAKRTADIQTRVDREKAAYQEIETFGQGVFDKLGTAMEQSWEKGADAAKVWRDAITSIINDVLKEFFKLAVLNPLMNDLFGSNKPTLGDLFGGNKGEGGGGLLGSGGGGGGIIGGLVNKVGGEGFFQGGGLIGSLFGSGSVGLAGGLGGVYHAGGVVGLDRTPMMLVPPGLFDHAPRYASGLGSDEFAAILHRSERVLTSAQNDRTERVLSRVANSDGPRTHREGMPNVVFNISTPDADSFRASQPQIAARTVTAVNRSIMRMKT